MFATREATRRDDDLKCNAGAVAFAPQALAIAMASANGFVVVSEWLQGRYPSSRATYDHYEKLEDAVAYHRRLVAGGERDYGPKGIFAARDGCPIGGMLDVATIEAVAPGGKIGWGYAGAQSTPENRTAVDNSIYNGRRVA